MRDTDEVCAAAVIVIIIASMAFFAGLAQGRMFEKRDAAKAGVAHYEVNPETGNTKFVYATPSTDHPAR